MAMFEKLQERAERAVAVETLRRIDALAAEAREFKGVEVETECDAADLVGARVDAALAERCGVALLDGTMSAGAAVQAAVAASLDAITGIDRRVRRAAGAGAVSLRR